jgi:hypothetical protein
MESVGDRIQFLAGIHFSFGAQDAFLDLGP